MEVLALLTFVCLCFFSICMRGFTKLTDVLARKVLEPAEKLHFKITIEQELNTEIFRHLILICNVTLETTGVVVQLFLVSSLCVFFR